MDTQIPVIIVAKPAPNHAGDCACAAAVGDEQAEEPPHAGPLLRRSSHLTRIPMDGGCQVVYHQVRASGPLVLNQASLQILDFFANPRPLAALAELQDISTEHSLPAARQLLELGYLHPAASPEPETPNTRPDMLIAWLHVTDRCNLRCPYCYLPHQRVDMSLETGQSVLEAIFRSAREQKMRRVQIKYAGGEPALRLPFVYAMQRRAAEMAAAGGFKLDALLLTNGVLLDAAALESLRGLGIRPVVSLDGVDAAHDVQRPLAGGGGSFEQVVRAIDLASTMGWPAHISITVTGRNAASLADTVRWVMARGLTFHINFYRENEYSAGRDDLLFEEQALIAGMQAAYAAIAADVPRHSLLASLVDRASLAAPHTHTCGVGQYYLVFDPHGQAASCHMHLKTAIPSGAPGLLLRLRQEPESVSNPAVSEKEGCNTCEWRHACAGGCPLVTYRATGRSDVKSPNCRIYKALLPEALRLEGLRLLRWGSDA